MTARARPVGRTADAGWEIGVSRTVPLPLEEAWALVVSPEGLAAWLGAGATLAEEPGTPYLTADGTTGEVRSYRSLDRVRVTWRPPTWDHDTTVQIALSAKGPDRTVIGFHQERMADAGERERQRAHWSAVMDRLLEARG